MSIQISEGVSKVIVREGSGNSPNEGAKIVVQCTGSLNTNPPKKFWRYDYLLVICVDYYSLLTAPRILDRSRFPLMWALAKSSKVYTCTVLRNKPPSNYVPPGHTVRRKFRVVVLISRFSWVADDTKIIHVEGGLNTREILELHEIFHPRKFPVR